MEQIEAEEVRDALELLEIGFNRLCPDPDQDENSADVVHALNQLYGAGGLCAARAEFDGFLRRREDRLLHIYSANVASKPRLLFLYQPASLMIFHLLDRDKFILRDAWVKYFPVREVERLAVLWGEPYAT